MIERKSWAEGHHVEHSAKLPAPMPIARMGVLIGWEVSRCPGIGGDWALLWHIAVTEHRLWADAATAHEAKLLTIHILMKLWELLLLFWCRSIPTSAFPCSFILQP